MTAIDRRLVRSLAINNLLAKVSLVCMVAGILIFGAWVLLNSDDVRSDGAALVVGYLRRGDLAPRMCVVAKDPPVRYIGQVSIRTGCYLMDPSLAANPPAVGTCNDFRLASLRRQPNTTAQVVAPSKGPCDVPPDEASCFWDYFQQSTSPIGIPVAGSPDWDHPVCGPPHP
jgi:hypothetical protein